MISLNKLKKIASNHKALQTKKMDTNKYNVYLSFMIVTLFVALMYHAITTIISLHEKLKTIQKCYAKTYTYRNLH